ncbi:helix-turn-helix domain-containing protein [Streptomyces sp900105755]|uniref:helix-turn-helix domain-containing protein n=1 Tax=Streptomyces sp. 900105755 TaxID=3154389 RepID=UPI0033224E11
MSQTPSRAPYLKGAVREETAARFRAQYEAGATVRELAEQTGRSYGGVLNLLRLAGTEMRPWGFQPKNDD